VERAYDLE
jgi:5-methyltetrahydropteroyltriglutamate--homocysteine methyltransferase